MGTEASPGRSAETTPPRLEALVLAGGSARRFGGRKLLADWNGAPLLHAALRVAGQAPVRSVTLVTGADAGLIAAAGLACDPALRIVHADDHVEGLAGSLRAGVASLPSDTDGVFVLLGDMPRVPAAVLRPMAEALGAGAAAVTPVFAGKAGNPVLLGSSLFAEVAELTGDTGARAILQRLGSAVAQVEAPDEGIFFDVDSPSDLAR